MTRPPIDPAPPPVAATDLLDYRRRVADLYARVRRTGVGEEAWRTWAAERERLLADHPASPFDAAARASGVTVPCFPYDPRLHVGAVEIAPAEPAAFAIDHGGGATTSARRVGTLAFPLLGRSCTLSVFWLDGYGDGAFVPFRDATSGTSTYAAGRYLLDTAKSADLGGDGATVIVDLNFAYHPSCVHDARWSCPLSPPENHLPVAVEGGERLPTP